MSGRGAALEAKYWGKGLRVIMVDKAATERSGATGEGLSAINCYMGMKWGWNQPEDYVAYVRNDMMGIAREDLTYAKPGPVRGEAVAGERPHRETPPHTPHLRSRGRVLQYRSGVCRLGGWEIDSKPPY
jgi:hypothetical protein